MTNPTPPDIMAEAEAKDLYSQLETFLHHNLTPYAHTQIRQIIAAALSRRSAQPVAVKKIEIEDTVLRLKAAADNSTSCRPWYKERTLYWLAAEIIELLSAVPPPPVGEGK